MTQSERKEAEKLIDRMLSEGRITMNEHNWLNSLIGQVPQNRECISCGCLTTNLNYSGNYICADCSH